MDITERGIDGTSVYLIRVSYFPKSGCNDDDDDDKLVLLLFAIVYHESCKFTVTTGRVKLKVAPFLSGLFSAHIVPSWASIMLFDMNNPNPVPPASFLDLLANFENNLFNSSESIPIPVSLTVIMASSCFVPFSVSLTFFSISRNTVPSLVNLIALLKRLEIT